jgi:hypothetical protein
MSTGNLDKAGRCSHPQEARSAAAPSTTHKGRSSPANSRAIHVNRGRQPGGAGAPRRQDNQCRWGDPLYSANGLGRIEAYLDLVSHFRERLAHHGHDPARALIAVGVHSPIITDRSQDALAIARPASEASVSTHFPDRRRFPFDSL